MFQIHTPSIAYSDPWNIPLSQRIQALSRGKYKVAYFYESANNSTFRYRAYNMVQVLNENKFDDTSASYFFLSDMHRMDEVSDLADVLVVCRSGYNHIVNQLITKFRIKKKRVLFDIDDLVFNTSYAHLILNTLGQNPDQTEVWDYWFAYLGRMGETLRLCDGAITTNYYLAKQINDFSGLPVKVVPNFMNREQIVISDTIFKSKKDSGFERDGKITLGYFSGSPSHQLDYAIISSALEAVMGRDDRIELLVVGYIETGQTLSKFGKRIQYHPFQDYVNLQRLISCVEFNLMPLQSNTFTNCKSELKYFEAAIVGTVSIASPSYTYGAAIEDGKNGYISQSHQWASTIEHAVHNMSSYADMAILAQADARKKYAWFNQREVILNALGF